MFLTLNISDVLNVWFVFGKSSVNFGTRNGGSPGGMLFDAENGRSL